MKIYGTLKVLAGLMVMSAMTICLTSGEISDRGDGTVEPPVAKLDHLNQPSSIATLTQDTDVIVDPNVQLCQGYDNVGYVNGAVGPVYNTVPGNAAVPAPPSYAGGGEVVYENSGGAACGVSECDGGCSAGYSDGAAELPSKFIYGVDSSSCSKFGHEPGWKNQKLVPWEQFAYGEYIGPHRTPHVGEYRVRVNDNIEFVYLLTREQSVDPYQLFVGDQIQVSSAIDASLNQREITVLSDGTVSLSLIGQVRVAGKTVADLQRELNDKYSAYVKTPAIVVGVTKGDTPLQDVRDAVDARQGQGGQLRQAIVSPDGTLQLPLIGSVPVVGLTLEEIRPYDGKTGDGRILIAVNKKIFDMTRGKRFYGPGIGAACIVSFCVRGIKSTMLQHHFCAFTVKSKLLSS